MRRGGARSAGGLCIPAQLRAQSVLIAGAHTHGLGLISSSAEIVGSEIRDTVSPNLWGDGLYAAAEAGPASATIVGMKMQTTSRAAIASFGAEMDLTNSDLRCQEIDLNVETYKGAEGTIADGGGVVCGCEEPAPCRAVSASLDPPEAL